MKKKLFALTMTAFMGLSVLAGCGGSTPAATSAPAEKTATATAVTAADEQTAVPAEKQLVRHNLGSEPKTLDPQINTAVDGSIVIHNMFEGLTRLDKEDKAIPGIAEKWEISEDGLKYTFHLRDAKWSDGKPVVAGDFVYAWQRAVDPATAAEYAYQMWYIKNGKAITDKTDGKVPTDLGAKAIDDKTLEVTLESKCPYFLEMLDFPTYYPVRKDIVEANGEGWIQSPETFVSNGAFKISEWKHNDSITLVKNPEYYDAAAVKLDEIKFLMIAEASTAFAAFQANELDYVSPPPTDQIPILQQDNDANFKINPYLGTYFVVFNTKKAPFDNPKVRKAFFLAIDQQAIVTTVTKGGQKPAPGFTPEGLFLSDGKEFREVATTYGNAPNGNVEEAKKLLAEAGFPDGKGFPAVEYLYNTSESHKAVGEALQQMWKKALGVDVTLKNEEWAVFQDDRQHGNYTIARHGWIGDYGDPMTFLDMWYSTSENNDADWVNAAYDKAIDTAKSVLGPERDKAMLDADKILNEDQPIAPIYYYTNPTLLRTTIKGVAQSILGSVIYRDAYVTQ